MTIRDLLDTKDLPEMLGADEFLDLPLYLTNDDKISPVHTMTLIDPGQQEELVLLLTVEGDEVGVNERTMQGG